MEESKDSGYLITFDHYIRMMDGRIEKNRSQTIFNGPISEFKKRNPMVAIIGYNEMHDGEVSESSVMLNEKLPPLKQPDKSISGTITPEMMAKAGESANKIQNKEPVVQPEVQKERIVKDGDSYIKIVGNKIFKLNWCDYDDASAKFDEKIKVEDGIIKVMKWQELNE